MMKPVADGISRSQLWIGLKSQDLHSCLSLNLIYQKSEFYVKFKRKQRKITVSTKHLFECHHIGW